MIDRLVFDFDYMKYSIAAVCETRTIIVTHKKSGDMKEFDNRTEFYGAQNLKKAGGWLGEVNKERKQADKSILVADDFLIEDKLEQTKPTSKVLEIVDQHIQGVCKILGVSKYHGYIGKGASWRLDASTILEYKGQRKDNIKPLALEAIETHLKRKHNAKEVTGLEADDWVVIDTVGRGNRVLVGVDKDYEGCDGVNLFNPDKMEEFVKVEGLGSLWIDEKNKVRGRGRKFFYFQLLSGDDSDNYCANSASATKWGDKSAFKLLGPCTDDAQCWDAVVTGYQKLYPEHKEIVGWRGDSIMIDWRYVLAENCQMAYMLRKLDDKFVLEDFVPLDFELET